MTPLVQKIIKKFEAEKEIWDGTRVAFVFKLAGLFLGYLFTLIVAKNYHSQELGNYIIAYLILDLLCIVALWGTDTFVVSIISKFSETADKTALNKTVLNSYFIVLLNGVILTLFAKNFSNVILSFFFQHNMGLQTHFNTLLLVIIPLSIVRLNSQILRGMKKILHFSFFNYASVYIPAIVMLLFIKQVPANPKLIYTSVLDSSIVAALLSSVVVFFFLFRREKSATTTAPTLFQFIRLSSPIALSDIISFFNNWIGTFLVSLFLTEKETGWFGLAFKVSVICSIITVSVNSITSPRLSSLYAEKNDAAFKSSFRFATKIVFWSSFLLNIGIILIAPFALNLLGSDFMNAYPVLVVLIIAQTIESYVGTSTALLPMVAKQKALFYLVSSKTVLTTLFGLILIPKFGLHIGLLGAGIAIVLSSIIYTFVLGRFVRKSFGLKINLLPEKTK